MSLEATYYGQLHVRAELGFNLFLQKDQRCNDVGAVSFHSQRHLALTDEHRES